MPLLGLVPTAQRVARVARRLCDASDGALFGRQVTTFDALAASLVAASGDRRPILGALGERLLAAEVGSEVGGAFGRLSLGDGLAGTLAAALVELRRGEVTSDDARAAAATLEGASRARLEAVASALAGWERRLDGRGLLDRAGAVRAAATAAARRVTVEETEAPTLLLLDGFATLAPAEWDLCAAVARRAGAIRVHLPHLADHPAATAAAEPLARRVESLHELAATRPVDVLLERTDDPARAPRLAALLRGVAGGEPLPAGGAGTVELLCAAGAEAEARAVAAVAAAWLDAGMAPEELRVFSPAPGVDAARLARAFADAAIPFASGRGPALADVPVVRAIREALGAAGGAGRRAAERLARSSYLSLGEPVARLGALLDRAGAFEGRAAPAAALRGRAAVLGEGGARERAGLGRAADRLDALAALLAPLDEPGTARRHAARLAAFVDAAGIRRRAARAERPVAARDLAALGKLADVAEEAARALALLGRGEERLPRAAWLGVLDAALAGASVASAGEPFGGAVELLGLEEAPGESARGALLVGCGRATFPSAPGPEPVLREPERQALCARLRRGAVATAAVRRADARHRAVCAVAAAREAIHLSWIAEEGAVSPLVEAGLASAGIELPRKPAPGPSLGACRSTRDTLRAAVRDAQERPRGAVPPALSDRVASARERGGIERARREAVDRRESSAHAGAVPPAELAPSLPDEWTPSQLEEYARCPYRLFLGVGLGLPSREAAGVEIDPRDEGRLVHAALERLLAARVARGAWPPAGDAADRAEAEAAADAACAELEAAGKTGDPSVWAARRRAVRARLVRWIEAEARDADGLVPRLLEHRFGGESGNPPLRLGEGAEAVAVKGRIDRVDADGRRLLVIDYKNGRASPELREALDPATFGVTSFQIPLYLAAAARALPGRAELGATLALLRDGERLAPLRGGAEELAAGPLGAGLHRAVVGVVARAREGRFPIVSRGCDRCDFGAVCRFQGVAEIEDGSEPSP